jgi:hypothetical protein
MTFDSKFKPGMEVKLYRDPETEKELLGTARLRELRNTGLPFILTEAKSELEQKTFVLEEWMVEWLMVDYKLMSNIPWLFREDRPHKIMRVQRIGI